MPSWLQQTLGVAIVLFILLDVFLTVLYARVDSGVLSFHLARSVWLLFRRFCRVFGRYQEKVLSFCGPMILVLILFVWALLLTLGMALIIHPALGTGVVSTGGSTPTDFVSALYAGGGSMAIVGSNTFAPKTPAFRLLYLLNSLVGMSVLSLTLTYLMQVYTALYRRNSFGYSLHLASDETGDAAELIAGLGPEGHFQSGYTSIAQWSSDMTELKESHHFYPVLFFFRFPEPANAVPRITLLLLDTVSLIKSGLDDDKFGWLKESAPLAQLWRGCLALDISLAETFLSGEVPPSNVDPDPATRDRWRRRYFAGLRRLAQAGIPVIRDVEAGAKNYVRLRGQWQPHIDNLGPALGFSPQEVDPIGTDPGETDRRPEFRRRLHSVG